MATPASRVGVTKAVLVLTYVVISVSLYNMKNTANTYGIRSKKRRKKERAEGGGGGGVRRGKKRRQADVYGGMITVCTVSTHNGIN